MYEDSWYNFVPEINNKQPQVQASPGHRRKESTLLQQPNGTGKDGQRARQSIPIFEESAVSKDPPEPTIPRRAASFSNLSSRRLSNDGGNRPSRSRKEGRTWNALMLPSDDEMNPRATAEIGLQYGDPYEDEFLETSQEKYLLYQDQLMLTERHLDGLISDANATLELLTTLSNSFQSVEEQTTTFQSQCEELLTEQRRLEKLADEVGTDLRYYAYLETATRRLNAPGASRLVDDSSFGDMMEEIESCISFMAFHENYRERDSYLARYEALLTKALHLLDLGFTAHLEKVSTDIARQLAATTSDSARYALAYGRFEEMMMESYSLLPNLHRVIHIAYDEYGTRASSTADTSVYSNTTSNILRSYLSTRDRDTKLLTQHDIEQYQKEAKELSVETASRSFIKQLFERLQNESELFQKLFELDPRWNKAPDSVFQVIKAIQTTMIHPGNITPMATTLQSVLQTAELQSTCHIVGWIASEFSIIDDGDDEDATVSKKQREYAARLLVEHLWPFTDAAFELEITKLITKGTVDDSSLKISPVIDGVPTSNAYPLVNKAIELLAMFDHSMPKERSSQNSPVVFKIVRETIQVLQRAEARIRSTKADTDPDLFIVKNLLILKNELVSLEIGDIRSQPQGMQHFGQIWDTISPQNWVGFIGSMLPGRLWPLGGGGGGSTTAPTTVTAKTLTVEDMSEQLDELLRQSIYAFTKRWGTLVLDSRNRKTGTKPIAKVETELEAVLQTAFSHQPEVVAKLKEAIELNSAGESQTLRG